MMRVPAFLFGTWEQVQQAATATGAESARSYAQTGSYPALVERETSAGEMVFDNIDNAEDPTAALWRLQAISKCAAQKARARLIARMAVLAGEAPGLREMPALADTQRIAAYYDRLGEPQHAELRAGERVALVSALHELALGMVVAAIASSATLRIASRAAGCSCNGPDRTRDVLRTAEAMTRGDHRWWKYEGSRPVAVFLLDQRQSDVNPSEFSSHP